MPFHIQPIREFLVRPALPSSLSRMNELAYNILWSWEPIVRALFRRLDPTLWRDCGYNPVLMLGRVSQSTLRKAASDPRYLALYKQACDTYDARVRRGPLPADGKLIAYFSAEYGLTECLPVYSGGLGVLSGDHLKSSSDQDYPLIALGLLYQQGYFRQFLNPDGWQQERYPVNDFYTLPVTPVNDAAGHELKVTVKLPTGNVFIQVWKLEVGRTTLYLLDTNIPENLLPQDRDITDSLYGGDTDTRIRQEIVLGIGGMRALAAMGLSPTVFHMNEGHSAFLALEQIRRYRREQGLTFEEAWEAARTSNVFTTHTPVPAGIDLFDAGLMYHYFSEYCGEIGIDFQQLMALGRRNPQDRDERFSMAVLALNTSSYRNAVSRLHREISQEMFHDLWPQLPVWEVPITSVTNGVHLPSWLNGDLAALYDQYLEPDWRDRMNDPSVWHQVADIPDEELVEVHRRRKRRLVSFVRARANASAQRRQASTAEVRRAGEVLDPNAFTIGFARRFATYKRATLLFRDVERLKRIVLDKDMPVQIVIAGKAHPKDQPGKSYIREIVQLSRDPDLWKHLVFLEDYDMKVARELVQGVDLWLNTPRRGEEACGTSGMKAAINGVLNLSILDGWFDEAYEGLGGWAIGEREPYSEDQDALHASAIYYLLENEIVPMFYERKEQTSREWIRRVKQSLMYISPNFDCRRMVRQYMTQLYDPAHSQHVRLLKSDYNLVHDMYHWNSRVREVWDRVRFLESGPSQAVTVISGKALPVRAAVELAGLTPQDVRVEVVMGRVDSDGNLEETEVMVLPVVEQEGSVAIFGKEVVPERTGRLGYALRVSPDHFEDPLTRPCSSLLKWSGVV
ncbi:MAG TPA: alpha-glucan family phosphorylase [Bryobacteraceae bacterium]|jgi:starch phosphorylase|nr:alpha-glucan family phosphorylase [Bryobacteraceae bacterium]